MMPATFSSPVAMRLAADAHKAWAEALRIEAAATEQRKAPPAPVAAPAVPAATPGFCPVEEWESRHPWPTESGLRSYIADAAHNGFEPCIVRIGRRILIDEARFRAWVEDHRDAASTPAAPAKARRGRKSNLKPEFEPARVLKIAPRIPANAA